MPGEGLTVAQQLFWDSWPGRKVIVHNEQEAIEAVLGKGAVGGCDHYEPTALSDICARCNGTRFSHNRP